jgi:hypothetical protein
MGGLDLLQVGSQTNPMDFANQPRKKLGTLLIMFTRGPSTLPPKAVRHSPCFLVEVDKPKASCRGNDPRSLGPAGQ